MASVLLPSHPPRMHHRTKNWLSWIGYIWQDKENSEPTGMCRLLCLDSWFPFLDLEQDNKEMLSQNLKSWENETNGTRNRPNLWQQQMWQFRFGIRQIYKGSPWTRQQEFLILIHSSGTTEYETTVNPGMYVYVCCIYLWLGVLGFRLRGVLKHLPEICRWV